VVEGRDIGAVVFPERVKVFLTATPREELEDAPSSISSGLEVDDGRWESDQNATRRTRRVRTLAAGARRDARSRHDRPTVDGSSTPSRSKPRACADDLAICEGPMTGRMRRVAPGWFIQVIAPRSKTVSHAILRRTFREAPPFSLATTSAIWTPCFCGLGHLALYTSSRRPSYGRRNGSAGASITCGHSRSVGPQRTGR
jgi:hypothetical protein